MSARRAIHHWHFEFSIQFVMSHPLPNQTDVIVIGAGMSGLSAAQTLNQAGIDVCLIEAQARVGGRVCSQIDERGQLIELGAQAFNRDMKMLAGAARQHGLNRVPLHHLGQVCFDGIEPRLARKSIQQIERLLDRDAWDTANFEPLASDPATSLADAVDLLSPDDQTRQMMDSYIQELWGRPMTRLQFAHAIDISERFDSNRDDWQFQLVEGFGSLAERMAGTLSDRLHLDTPAQRIELGDAEVSVFTARDTIRARAVIVAVPPTVARSFIPQDHASQRALSAFEAGDLIKFVVQYDDTFWRQAGYSGESVSVELPGFATADGTLAGGGTPTLIVFIGGSQARQLHALSSQQRRLKVQTKLIEIFGEPAGKPLNWTERSWVDEPWVGGAYNAHVRPDGMLEPDALLRRFEDRITFACAEIASRFPGYVEGALHEGAQAAERVLSGLGIGVTTRPARSSGWWSKLKARFQS